ncbi:LacI family DNA-binding transcriptional regulator [Paenibacillus sp. GCM10023248]|uniref:LacI family DNA-binding transcriptional regulator n=1 Tax=Bacillales TaxID=1385 RepID=UPI0023783E06|nr:MULTISPECIES: LacI family DNA-binding transcriptional regulator [Bacillales]MDD9268046.1 LacI family DNA-binding transcriptional regulator [Paenibacillus sp. MAHUQ-63]MDR6879719.1 LacI family transcriptional regulator [Bacillus sp. 3255]
MKPTIYDVAQAAGVSIATVSKVINETGRISEKTRAHVQQVMQQLKYKPSMVASALTGKSTYTIGLTLPDLANPFFAEIARAVEDRGHECGFSVFICSTDNDPDKEVKYLSLLTQKRVDGMISATRIQNDRFLKKLIQHNIPIALITGEMPTLAVDTVMVDDYLGGFQAGSHLVELGHRHIAILVEDPDNTSNRERIRGCKQALANAGLQVEERHIATGGFTVETGHKAMAQLIGLEDRPTAVFACNDLLAIGAIRAAREAGLQLPRDLSVVGFDNTILATLIDPPLTTIAQPIQEIGRRAVDLLVQEIQGEKVLKQRVVLLPELVLRHSTGTYR